MSGEDVGKINYINFFMPIRSDVYVLAPIYNIFLLNTVHKKVEFLVWMGEEGHTTVYFIIYTVL